MRKEKRTAFRLPLDVRELLEETSETTDRTMTSIVCEGIKIVAIRERASRRTGDGDEL